MALVKIKSRWNDTVLFGGEYESLKACVEAAVREKIALNGASLNGASLDGASLDRASLDGASLDRASLNRASLNEASLDGASLDGASLYRASLNWASLDGASLNGASLYGASLDGCRLAWQSHDLLSEILRRAAGDDIEKLKVAGVILMMRDKCWTEFAALAERDPLGDWALGELAKWVVEGDSDPDIIRNRVVAPAAV